MNNAQKKNVSIVENKPDEENEEQKDTRPVCGLIMPIADTEGYPPGHWKEVRKLLISVAEEANFRARIVSESDDVRVIQAAIVQNVYDDDIVICDVSSKNPNVMFELGLRLAFDKAAVIVKDYTTGYSFDTSPVEHINYPKDLRYYDIEKFKIELKAKLLATYKESKKPNHSMYLQSFGKFIVKDVKTKEISNEDYILESLREIKFDLKNLQTTKANDYIVPYRKSAPITIKNYEKVLSEMLYEYRHNLKKGEAANPRNFYRFINEYQTFLGVDMPPEDLVYDFFKFNMK